MLGNDYATESLARMASLCSTSVCFKWADISNCFLINLHSPRACFGRLMVALFSRSSLLCQGTLTVPLDSPLFSKLSDHWNSHENIGVFARPFTCLGLLDLFELQKSEKNISLLSLCCQMWFLRRALTSCFQAIGGAALRPWKSITTMSKV